ncbi:MAG: GNAT family N-acetyltransferase [Actinomycetota bacterium]|nr:GNAT family N-acetyltransferase [Actinomycetota bacterium]
MKKVVVRPLESADLPGIDKLRILVYPHLPEARYVEWHSSIWRWLESHPLAKDEMHRWVLATEEGEVVGHLAAVPQYYRINGQRIVAHTPADYQVLPQYGFHALLLMRKFFRTAQNCVACDMVPAVIGVETRMGAEKAGSLHYAAKLLNVSRLPAPPIPAPIRRFLNLEEQAALARGCENLSEAGPPDAQEQVTLIRPRAPIPAPIKRLLNGGLRVVDEALGGVFGGNLKVEVLEGFDESFDELFEKIAAVVPCLPEKDAAFLRWRYGPGSPQNPVTILGVRGEEGLLGYAVLGVTVETPQGFRDAYILDLMTLPGRRDVARALLREAVRYFRRAGTPIIRYRFLMSHTSPRSSDVRRLGFFYRNRRRNTLLVKFADRGLHKTANDTANWSYSIGDGEATIWVKLN